MKTIATYILLYGWIIPSAVLTVHTLLTTLYIFLRPIRSKVPMVLGVSILVCIYSNFELEIYTRPSIKEIVLFTLFGLVPGIPIIILLFYLFIISLFIIPEKKEGAKHE